MTLLQCLILLFFGFWFVLEEHSGDLMLYNMLQLLSVIDSWTMMRMCENKLLVSYAMLHVTILNRFHLRPQN